MNQSFFHQDNFNTDKSQNLPIIQKLETIYQLWQSFLQNFSRTSRYTLGAKTDNVFIEVIEFIFTAAHEREKESKLHYLQKATKKLDLLKFFLQLLWKIKALDNKKYIAISEQLFEIGKMLGGWERSLNKKQVF